MNAKWEVSFNVATYATSNHVNFAEEKVKTVIYFSKVFFVKGKEGKEAFLQEVEEPGQIQRGWANQRRKETNARHQRDDNRRTENRSQKMKGTTRRNRRPKQDRICNQRWTERLRTQTSSRKHAISTALHFSVLYFFFHFLFPSVSRKICERWDFRKKKKIIKIPILHFVGNLENGNLKFIRNRTLEDTRNLENAQIHGSLKIEFLDIKT